MGVNKRLVLFQNLSKSMPFIQVQIGGGRLLEHGRLLEFLQHVIVVVLWFKVPVNSYGHVEMVS